MLSNLSRVFILISAALCLLMLSTDEGLLHIRAFCLTAILYAYFVWKLNAQRRRLSTLAYVLLLVGAVTVFALADGSPWTILLMKSLTVSQFIAAAILFIQLWKPAQIER